MDYHVSTPAETQLVMQTAGGRVVLVLPAPSSSLRARTDAKPHYGPQAEAVILGPHVRPQAPMAYQAAAAPDPPALD
ncbi:hypothetical protein [Massilia sp. Root1485]|uniref:hypothetical protein n=1 Tax=Massilia sp. Root1485 TaxID=1736472 RepID=UPI0006FE9186|nr:hypothetical protein [Massilia sp. Root1485]KQZ34308.1 hypothetical protein ASD92_08320 [Massilia sp. Root1485]